MTFASAGHIILTQTQPVMLYKYEASDSIFLSFNRGSTRPNLLGEYKYTVALFLQQKIKNKSHSDSLCRPTQSKNVIHTGLIVCSNR